MSSFEPIPLAVGFAGHRDISPDDEDKLREALKQRLSDLKAANHPTPIRAFSGLAEGADMAFVAAAAKLEIEIILVLPVPQEQFVRDFEHPAHPGRNPEALKRRFETLLESASYIHTVPLPDGQSPESIEAAGAARDAQYSAAGAFIVRQSSILIAAWNGVTTGKPGGTSDVVRFKRDGVPPQAGETEDFPRPPDGGPVMQLGVTRIDSMGATKPSWHRDGYPEPEQTYRSEFKKSLRLVRTFNRDALEFARDHPDRVAESRGRLLPSETALDEVAARAVEFYAVADAKAISLQRGVHWIFAIIAALAVSMVIVFELYGHLPEFDPGWVLIVAYEAIFVAAIVVYWFERCCKYHARYLDYRCVAEGLRVQIFWHLAGLTEVVADSYLHQVRSELRWIRDALRSTMLQMPKVEPRLDLVRQRWVWSQSEFFIDAAKREQDGERFWSWITIACFLVGLILTAALGIAEFDSDPKPLSHHRWEVIATLMTIVFLSAIAGAAKSYAIKRAYAEHAKQYGRMARIFSLARKRLDSINDQTLTDRTHRVLFALGREALAETAEWILLHRERQIEPPI